MFCVVDESIEHLLFSCTVSRFVCNMLECAFNSPTQPKSMAEMSAWLNNF
jgi:hypothetical protein